MVISTCLTCAKEERDDGSKLLTCTKCKAGKYCSRACQRSDWKHHKKWCKLVEGIPIDSKIIQADCSQDAFINMNVVFDYAGHYMDDLRQMHIFISEMVLNYWSPTAKGSGFPIQFAFNAKYLERFLENRKELRTFGLYFCRRYPHIVRAMTNAGRVLIPLSKLESLYSLSLSHVHFDQVSDFTAMLRGRAKVGLKLLDIRDLSVGYDPSLGLGSLSHWSQGDAEAIAKTIQEMEALEFLQFLDLEDQCLQGRDDSVLARMLTNKPNLRHFGLGALDKHELQMYGRSCQGSLTDRGIAIIVEKIGGTVQQLSFFNQTLVTPVGLECILRGCPLLRRLEISGSHFEVQDLERILPLSSTLIVFRFGNVPPFKKDNNLERFFPAVLATNGRIILVPGGDEVEVDPEEFSDSVVENYSESHKLLKRWNDQYQDVNNEYTNFWDFLL